MPSTATYYTFLLLLFGLSSSWAQNLQIRLTCTLAEQDQPAAERVLELEQIKSGRRWALKTNTEGVLVLADVPPGHYRLHLPTWANFADLHLPADGPTQYHLALPYYDADWTPSPNSTLKVYFRLCDSLQQPMPLTETLTIRSQCGKKHYEVQTNAQGQAELELPLGCAYVLSLEGAPNYYKFDLPNRPYAYWTEAILFERVPSRPLYPSMRLALFNCVFEDLEGKRVAGESFWLENTTTQTRYEAQTNAYGIAQIQVPLNAEYTLSATHNPRFITYDVRLLPDQDLYIQTLYYKDQPHEAWLQRRAEQAQQAALLDALVQAEAAQRAALLDSIRSNQAEERWIQDVVAQDEPLPIKRTLRIRKAVHAKAKNYAHHRQINPQHAEDHRHPILAVLERHQDRWKGKVVVTDVTQSMEPYLDEVLIWHLLKANEGETLQYVFFNDGDQRPEGEKTLGQTGGLYTYLGTQQRMDSVLRHMAAAVAAGTGGTPPENDLEALLLGAQYLHADEELILIADAHSTIRDFDLLAQLGVPVRIILCGAEERNRRYRHLRPDLNEEYLTLARQTGGSVHTLHEDLLELGALQEGEQVQVGRFWYLLRNNHFIKLHR